MRRVTTNKNNYDIVIVGAGVGGLICGNYLALKGLKVLIIEQHNKVGGYCTSFKRNNFIFDAGVHELTQCGKDGVLGKIISLFSLERRISIKRSSISDIIQTKDYKISLNKNYNITMENLQKVFPKEKDNIRYFFSLFKESAILSLYSKFNKRSFRDLVHSHFHDNRLRNFWYIGCCEMGLEPSRLPAIVGFSFWKAFITDSGYYPIGGMLAFSSALQDNFIELGGKIILSNKVEKIVIKNKKIQSVITKNKEEFITGCVVSTCDPLQTFLDLIGKQYINSELLKYLKNNTPSPSFFIVFLGLRRSLKESFEKCTAILYYPEYPSDKQYNATSGLNKKLRNFIFVPTSFLDPKLAPDGGESIYLFKAVPYINERFWEKNKTSFAERMITNAELLIPNLRNNIAHKELATPQTLFKYTLNSSGAGRGWSPSFCNTGYSVRNFNIPIHKLYLAGHWAPSPIGNGGISMAAYSGVVTAKNIIREFSKTQQ